MKRYNDNDWTDAVRRRLEGRELTPPESLWESLGQALPEAGAAPKVRRLAWGGAVGAAAAAALAAVLLLRPFGVPEDARIDVFPTPAAPLAEALKEEAVTVQENHSGQESDGFMSPAAPRMTKEDVLKQVAGQADVMKEEADVATTAGQPAEAAYGSQSELGEAPVSVQARPERSDGTMSVQDHTVRSELSTRPEGEAAMSIDDLIAQDNALRRHRSFNASLYAAGVPSANFMFTKDYAPDIVALDRGQMGYMSNPSSSSDIGSSTGITYNPEDPSGYVKVKDDPYNIVGGGRLNHSKPVSAGIALTYSLDKHLFLESGLYYSYLHSYSYQLKDQKLHSLGVPLKLGYRFGSAGRTSFSLSAGAKAEKCILATRGEERFKEPGIQLAAVGSAAVQYDFSPYIGIFIAPELSYWFTETKLPTYNTENPFNLSLKAGLNLTVGR